MVSSKTKRNISRIIPFGIIFLVSGMVFLTIEQAVTGNSGHPSTTIEMNFKVFIFSSLAITCVGLLVGAIERVYLHNVFAKKSFTKKILYKLLLYILLMFVITIITYPIAASLELDTGIFDKRVWHKLYSYSTSIAYGC